MKIPQVKTIQLGAKKILQPTNNNPKKKHIFSTNFQQKMKYQLIK